jgi:hypothetical protein
MTMSIDTDDHLRLFTLGNKKHEITISVFRYFVLFCCAIYHVNYPLATI